MGKQLKTIILIATHKNTQLPQDPLYLPIFVGSENNKAQQNPNNYQKDNEGENISSKNPFFCELTAIYWAWKNLEADNIGLCHYRRFFSVRPSRSKKIDQRLKAVLKEHDAELLMAHNSIILPNKRNYLIENLFDHYIHTMHKEPLVITEQIIKNKYPKYYQEFIMLHKRKTAHMFNMFIMRKDIFNAYCSWLFPILFELEKEVDKQKLKYDQFHSRFYGRISELLLDVYLRTENLAFKELPIQTLERTNWIQKGSSFIKAKYLGKKYEKSF